MHEKAPVIEITHCNSGDAEPSPGTTPSSPPLRLKVISTLLVCLMGFGTYYNQGVLGAVKTPLKKALDINNTQFSLIASTQDLLITLLIVFGGLITDRIGGAGGVIVGSAVGVTGSIIVASAVQVRSYKLMVFGSGVLALGNIFNATARYRLFSSWFPPSHGFALTLSLELAAAKIGLLVSKATANVIAEGAGDIAWTFWVAMFADMFVFMVAILVLFFVRSCRKKYSVFQDPSTGEQLLERTNRFEAKRITELPWPFWCIVVYHVFETTNHLTFTQNATELAEKRFHVSSKTAGWISGVVMGGNFFLLPLFGYFMDVVGHRLSVMCGLGTGMTIAMAVLRWAPGVTGTAVSFGIISVCVSSTFLVAYDGVRTSLWHQEIYGTANSIKVATGYAVNLIVRVVIGVIQDRDDGGYQVVILVYLALGIGAALTAGAMIVGARTTVDLGRFQWSRKQRAARGEEIAARTKLLDEQLAIRKNRLSVAACGAVCVVVCGAVASYIYACL
ncbi:putative mfs transporter protein [Neofusicoccum parvum UCRNP2]|uniref:Lysosomal dipeptide transporter MFSD1 n=1 Tax=Botryosphaeria parva (strain UCR-NP2) TaxID=1287680 RepID=R1E667_BOTPV|nr:putative mfs transporter protein [Neofusicoccum parvum UCRNP2]